MHGVGGNGPFVNPDPDPNLVPGRTGGGCIQSGPFKDLVVNLGPLNSLAYNPRCLTRDFSPYFAERYSGANNTQFCMSHEDYGSFFRGVMAKRDYEAYGLHGGGHCAVGGVMRDLYNSPAGECYSELA